MWPIEPVAYLAAKAVSYIPRGGRLFAKATGRAVPGLRSYPIETRYGRIYCDLRESACFPLLRYNEYPHWRGDEDGLARIPLGNDSIVLDVGANIGVMTRIFAARAGHVHAFEPAPRAQPLLARNTADLANVTIHQTALSNTTGTAFFEERAELDVSSLADAGIEVPVETIDSLGLVPALIKIDVEGYEHLVLEGAHNTIRDHAPVIMFEAFGETARQYCENIIRVANPAYRFESLGHKFNHIAWPITNR
jgi:FkbM family methyltransferase